MSGKRIAPSPADSEAREIPERLRIATFNLENLDDAPGHPTLAERIAVLRPQLVRLEADVLCLQEVNGQRQAGTKKRSLRALDALIEDTPYAGFARATTASATNRSVRDLHNLVVLSRFPVTARHQVRHDLVMRLDWHAASAGDKKPAGSAVEWDRPLLHVALEVGGDRPLHVLNLHLRAPRAAFVAGAKANARRWRTMSGWAEGLFLASLKRAGQALEARLVIDRLFDADADALIAVCGDFNADEFELPVRIITGDAEDAGNPALARRALVPLEAEVAEARRFTVIHHGRRHMLDHILLSPALADREKRCEIHNEGLGDEVETPLADPLTPRSFHAPVLAELVWAETGEGGRDGPRVK